ncbi:MAG: hypothetical protein LBT05_10095 [Planctomycetaceae bacterium]|jgi:hypothetical protein|nr:hypothetical protein [Planctomycetaceae bacterium]
MPEKLISFDNQIELPVAAQSNKSPVRKLEFDAHSDNINLHLPFGGEAGQIPVMTKNGLCWGTPVIRGCSGIYGYSCTLDFILNENSLARQGIDFNVVRNVEIV